MKPHENFSINSNIIGVNFFGRDIGQKALQAHAAVVSFSAYIFHEQHYRQADCVCLLNMIDGR